MPDLLPIELAYAAGIIDGEGTIGITEIAPGGSRSDGRPMRVSPQFRVYVSVAMTEPGAVLFLADLFGMGNVYSRPPRRPGHKGVHSWSVSGPRAAFVVEAIEPYLRVKREQASVVLDFYRGREWKQRQALSPEEIAERRTFVSTIHALNRRGAPVEG